MYNDYNNNNNQFKDVSYTTVENPMEPTVKNDSKAKKAIAFLLATALIGGASGFGGAYLSNSFNGNDNAAIVENTADVSKPVNSTNVNDTATSAPVVENLKNSDSTSSQLTTSAVINKVTPSVVSITSKFSDGTGTGTGIILTADGYITTNAHVVEAEVAVKSNNSSSNDFFGGFGSFFSGYGTSYEVEKAKEITVTLSNEKEYTAKLIGTDTATDLAILKIEAKNLTPAEIGSSEKLIMGEKAITLGYPLGMGLSASEGIISGLNKEMTIELTGGGTADMVLIQTDAAINPGNSGGPLINADGQIVGITSSKIVSSNIEGIGFAIPITTAMPLLEEIIENGYVANTTPKIGITGTDINSSVQRYYNLPVSEGVLVVSVDKGSSADLAGIGEGDVIVGADGKNIATMDELIKIKDKHKIGDEMTLTLARSSGNVEVKLTLGGQN